MINLQEQHWEKLFGYLTREGQSMYGIWTVYSPVETEILQATPTNSTFETPENKQEFNWRQSWYPVCFLQDLPTNRPYSFSLYDEPFVLFKDQNGQLICLTDRCPHRAARLSAGQIN